MPNKTSNKCALLKINFMHIIFCCPINPNEISFKSIGPNNADLLPTPDPCHANEKSVLN